jgi:hypothetical protein
MVASLIIKWSPQMNIELTEVKAAYERWLRLGTKRGRLPKTLKQMVVKLFDKYSLPVIAEAIGVTTKTLRNWKNNLTEDISFIPLPVYTKQPESSQTESTANELMLILPHGMRLALQHQSLPQTTRLLRALIEELSSCSI